MGNINFGNGNEEAGSVFTGEFGGQQNNMLKLQYFGYE